MKVLNIDQFVSPVRQLKFKGVSYDVNELNVQQFIDNLKAAEDLEKIGEEAPGSERARRFMDLSFKAIESSVPTFPTDELRALPMPTVALILNFVRGELDPEALTAGAPSAAPEGEGVTQEGTPEKKPD